jgi:hypothetical protein
MKRILTYTTALTLLAAPAFADTEAKMDLIRSAQQMLNEYDIAVDADSLTMEQLAEIKSIDVSDTSVVAQRLEQIVGASAMNNNVEGTVAAPAVNVDVTVPESEVVQSILDEYEIAVDADSLSNGQKAEILSLDLSDTSTAKQRLETIVAG